MKPKERLFFYKDLYHRNCYELSYYLEKSKDAGSEFHIVGAKIMYSHDGFYCSELDEVGLKSESECGSGCKFYKPRNNVSGRCRFSDNCYEPNNNIYLVSNGEIKEFK